MNMGDSGTFGPAMKKVPNSLYKGAKSAAKIGANKAGNDLANKMLTKPKLSLAQRMNNLIMGKR